MSEDIFEECKYAYDVKKVRKATDIWKLICIHNTYMQLNEYTCTNVYLYIRTDE